MSRPYSVTVAVCCSARKRASRQGGLIVAARLHPASRNTLRLQAAAMVPDRQEQSARTSADAEAAFASYR